MPPQQNQKKKEPLYGNYSNYYQSHRFCFPTFPSVLSSPLDPRLDLLLQHKSLFKDKTCLDIGCNDGFTTIQFFHYFKPKSILGMDLDQDRIQNADYLKSVYFSQLKPIEKMETTDRSLFCIPDSYLDPDEWHQQRLLNDDQPEVPYFPIGIIQQYNSVPLVNKPKPFDQITKEDLQQSFTLPQPLISFQRSDFMKSKITSTYQIIFCLSVVKWIHLHYLDKGLKEFFIKIYDLLEPNGFFILEPQSMKSYKKYQKKIQQLHQYKPEDMIFKYISFQNTKQEERKDGQIYFLELLKEIGFTLISELSLSPDDETKHELDIRPLWILQKQ